MYLLRPEHVDRGGAQRVGLEIDEMLTVPRGDVDDLVEGVPVSPPWRREPELLDGAGLKLELVDGRVELLDR